MHDKLIFTDGYIRIEFLLISIHANWMYHQGYPDPKYLINICYKVDNVGGEFQLTKEPILLFSEFLPLSSVLGNFYKTRLFFDTSGPEDCNYSVFGYPTSRSGGKLFFNLGMHLLFDGLDYVSTSGEMAVHIECSWEELHKFIWQLQARELWSIIWQTELILEEFPGLGFESILSGYRERYQVATQVLESWGKAIPRVFEPITVIKHRLPDTDREKWERVSKAIRNRFDDLVKLR